MIKAIENLSNRKIKTERGIWEMPTTTQVKKMKDLGWAKAFITSKTFDGAVAEFEKEGSGSKVPVLFVSDKAYVVEDAEGLYTTNDLVKGLIQNKGINHRNPSLINGTTILASYDLSAVQHGDDAEVFLADDELTRLGINYHEVRESLVNRLTVFKEVEASAVK